MMLMAQKEQNGFVEQSLEIYEKQIKLMILNSGDIKINYADGMTYNTVFYGSKAELDNYLWLDDSLNVRVMYIFTGARYLVTWRTSNSVNLSSK